MDEDNDEHERARAKAEADAKEVLAAAERLGDTADRLEALNDANAVDRRSAELAQTARRHEHRTEALRVEERSGGLARAAARPRGWKTRPPPMRSMSLQTIWSSALVPPRRAPNSASRQWPSAENSPLTTQTH